MSTEPVKTCKRCNCARPGILLCQRVIPNRWSEADKRYIFAPWLFRFYLCRYHLAAENHPRHLRIFGGRKRKRLEWKPDAEVIAEWERSERSAGQVRGERGWQRRAQNEAEPTR